MNSTTKTFIQAIGATALAAMLGLFASQSTQPVPEQLPRVVVLGRATPVQQLPRVVVVSKNGGTPKVAQAKGAHAGKPV